MPRPRRRTLSHSEIENFLSEISAGSENKPNKAVANGNPAAVEESLLKPVGDRQTVEKSKVLASIEEETADVHCSAESVSQTQTVSRTEDELIRQYCKIQYGRAVQSEETDVVALAREVLDLSRYKLLATRMLFPEQFPHPPASIEAKKALLISLSPMLTEAEEQRKRDTRECEEFTRCKSSRGRGRANYEYTDIDTSFKVDVEEFEKRYLLFINRHRPSAHHTDEEEVSLSAEELPAEVSLAQNDPPVSVAPAEVNSDNNNINITESNAEMMEMSEPIPETDSLSSSSCDDFFQDDALALDEGDFSFSRRRNGSGNNNDNNGNINAKRKRKHASLTNDRDRRGTLSPASARAMLLDAVEEEALRDHAERSADTETVNNYNSTQEETVCESSLDAIAVAAVSSSVSRRNLRSAQAAESCQSAQTPDAAAESRQHKRKTQRETPGWLRRHTLSPTSAKSLALELLESERESEREREMRESECVDVSERECADESEPQIVLRTEGVCESEIESACAMETETDERMCESSPCETVMCEGETDLVRANTMGNTPPPSPVIVQPTHTVESESHVLVSQLDELLCSEDEETTSSSSEEEEQEEETETLQNEQEAETEVETETPAVVDHEAAPAVICEPALCDVSVRNVCAVSAPSTPARTSASTDAETETEAEKEVEAMLLASPSTSALSAFFGRKSEIAAILHKAMSIFEEDEHELKIFERMENLVEIDFQRSSSIVPLCSSDSVEPLETIDVDEEEMAEIDEEAFALQAQRRMEERIAIARSKCQWEIASAQAINVAIRRMRRRKNAENKL